MTCSYNGIHLHSSYNPESEAKRFSESVKADFTPSCIVVIEPCLSYCAPFIRNRFPNTKICAVRLCAEFSASDHLWDSVISFSSSVENNSENTLLINNNSEKLFSELGEETIASTLFCIWPPSENAFSSSSQNAWESIKKAVLKSRDVLATRSHFSHIWCRNSIKNSLLVKNTCTIQKGNSPVVIAASGPSLESSVPFIKKYRNSFFLIAVSSALSVLLYNDIMPDVCITTDGGNWALFHINGCCIKKNDVTFAVASESSFPSSLYESHNVIPLSYGDSINDDFFTQCGIQTVHAERNGTVSGTAALLALSVTAGPVFMCGLDLAPSSSYQHTEPNAINQMNSLSDSRLHPLETRLTSSRFNSEGALSIYRSWFSSLPDTITSRLFRLSNNYTYMCNLGSVKECSWDYFAATDFSKQKFPSVVKTKTVISKNERKKILQSYILNMKNNEEAMESLCPLEYILVKKCKGTEKETKSRNDLKTKYNELITELEGVLDRE